MAIPVTALSHALTRHTPRKLGSWPGRIVVLALVLVPFAGMLTQLDRPLQPDEGVYATMARLIGQGGVPYRDLFDNKPPLQYAWYSAGLLVFGDRVEALRLTAGLLMSATALCVYLLGRLLLPARAAVAALAIFATSQLLVPSISDGLPETVMLLPQTAGLAALLYGFRRKQGRWFLCAGMLFGMAVMTKPVAIWPAMGLIPVIALRGSGGGRTEIRLERGRLVDVALYATGGVVVGASVVLPFVVAGATSEFLDSLVRFNLELSSLLSEEEKLNNLLDSLLLILFRPGLTALLTAGAFGLAVVAVPKPRRDGEGTFLVFALLSAVGVASTGYFYQHHYVQLFPILALGAAAGLNALPIVLSTPARRLTLTAVFGFFVVAPVGVATATSAAPRVPEPNSDPAYATVPADRQPDLRDAEFIDTWRARNTALGAYLEANSSEDDRIHVHGLTTERAALYFYAHREPAARLFFGWGLRVRPGDIPELVQDLEESRPLFIIDTFGPDYRYNQADGVDARPPEYLALLADQYELVDTIYFADVYRRRGAP